MLKKAQTKIYKKTKNKDLLAQLFLLTIFKCIIIGIVLFAIKQKHESVHSPRKLVNKDYFLSLKYFGDTYHSMELQTKSLHEWYAMSKIKFKSYKSFFQFLILLSGDIAMNPGPTSYPCAKCNRGVGSGILCNTCNFWIHAKCEGLSRSQLNVLSRTGNLDFICSVCREKQTTLTSTNTIHVSTNEQTEIPQQNISETISIETTIVETDQTLFIPENNALPFSESTLPLNEESFHFQEEHLQNISLEDESHIFKKKGLHFVHLNCNSLLSKIDEIREFVLHCKPHVICFSETKLDSTVTSSEVLIDGYSNIRCDRNRHGGGVACYVSNLIHYNERTDFSNDFENIFIDILLPKTTPILFGVVYRPPSTLNFDELLTSSLLNSINKKYIFLVTQIIIYWIGRGNLF